VVLYELLAGRLPFQAPNVGALISEVLTANPPPPSVHRPEVNKALDAICLKAMEKDPARRFRSMAEFADALGAVRNNDAAPTPRDPAGITAQVDTAAPSSEAGLATQLIEQLVARLEASEARARRRSPWPWLAGGAVAVLAVVLAWVVFFRHQPQAPDPK